jgi:glycosyltransferase involved in cell wall biosynthesis
VTAFTVVMAAHDTADTVASAVRSVLAQTRPDFELFVVDDGSRDGTAERVQPFLADERVRLLETAHAGAAAARGAGIAAGSAPLISMVDSDDLWMPDYLERMGAALDADPGASFAYTDAWYLDDASRQVRRQSAMGYQRPPEPPPATAADLFAVLCERNFIYNAVTVRRAAVDEAGPPDPRLRSMIDWEWWLRLTAAGHRAVRVPGRMAVYRLRPGSMSRDRERVVAGQRDLWRLVAAEYDLDPQVRARLTAKADGFDAELAKLNGPRARLVRAAVAARKSLTRRRDYFSEPPAEVADAFGDLRAV